jgi:hypothetical protein
VAGKPRSDIDAAMSAGWIHLGSYFTSAFAASNAIKTSLTPVKTTLHVKYGKHERYNYPSDYIKHWKSSIAGKQQHHFTNKPVLYPHHCAYYQFFSYYTTVKIQQ